MLMIIFFYESGILYTFSSLAIIPLKLYFLLIKHHFMDLCFIVSYKRICRA